MLLNRLGANRVITELSLPRWVQGSEEWVKLIRLCSACLEILLLQRSNTAHEAYDAIGDCTKLRRLRIGEGDPFKDDQMRKILLNNPRLEI